jgi:hypothetical protein
VPPASIKFIISLIVLGAAAMVSAFTVTHFCPDDRKVLVMVTVLIVEAIVFACLGALRPLSDSLLRRRSS